MTATFPTEIAGAISTMANDQYLALRDSFRTHARTKQLSTEQIAEFTMARVLLNAMGDPEMDDETIERIALEKMKKAFTPVTNKTKLANGQRRWQALEGRLNYLINTPVDRYAFTKDLGHSGHVIRGLADGLRRRLRSEMTGS